MAASEPLAGQISRPIVESLQSFSRTASTVVIWLGVSVILGWVFQIDLLKSVLPGSVTMKVNTALTFIFAGTSLWLWHRQPALRLTRFSSRTCAIAVLSIGLLTLIQYAFSIDLGIDQFLVKTPLDPRGDAAPGRMAVHSAFNFFWLGIDLLLLNCRRLSVLLTQLLAGIIFLIALLGMLGYLFGNAVFYRIGSPTSMAVHTSVAFLLLSLGILFARPQRGATAIFTQMDVGGLLARRLVPAAIVIPPLVCWLLLLGSRSHIYTPELGICLLSVLIVMLFTSLILASARSLSRFDQQRRQAQELLRQANDVLEQRVEDRTLQLRQTNNQLQTEIAERQAAQAALQAALQKLNFHVENSPLGVIEWDRAFRIARWSGAAEQIFGWQAETAIGRKLGDWQFIHEADQKIVESALMQFRSGKARQKVENRNYAQDGSVVHCEWYNSALFDEAGHLVSVLSLVLDISDRVRLEAERTQAVEENLRLLEQEQAARATAEQANRIKDEFLAVVSHELRTPLNPILGWSKLLRNGKLNPTKTTQAIETIERNAQLQVRLINDLLDIPRIMRGKLRLEIAPVNLNAVISAAIETVQLAAEAKSLSIQIDFPSTPTVISGDAGRLQQVVWNLLSNAVKFTATGGQIAIALSQVETNAQIQVKDSGKGIKPDFLPFVFEQFRQEDGAITRQFGGLGLGLAIVRQIVELHGGGVTAASAGEGQGATFTIQIPLSRRGDQPPSPSSPVVADNLSGVHILVVDDEPDARDFVAFVLEQAQAIVTIAASGVEALHIIEQSVPNLVLSDIGMPEMDGYRLMQQIRSLKSMRQVPAIALSAYVEEYDQQQAIEAGFQKHIPKPVAPEELVNAISSLIQYR